MNRHTPRLAALLCALALLFQLSAPPARAAQRIYFTAAGSDLLPLSDATMPFWSGGYLYVPSGIFAGRTAKTLGVACLPNSYLSDPNLRILYGGGSSLQFSTDLGYAQGSDGSVYYPGALRRGDEIYVPIAVAATFFELEYSVTTLSNTQITQGSYGALVWIRKPGFGISDREFANAAAYQINREYNEYLKSKEEAPGNAQTPSDTPEDPGSGKTIYLCLEAGEDAGVILDALDVYAAQAAFFCSREFLEAQGPLLRRMAAGGHAIGLLAGEGEDPEELLRLLEEDNAALARATMGKTRLVLLKDGQESSRRYLEERGYCCLEADLDRSGYELQSDANGESLLRRVSSLRGDVTVWLAHQASPRGLRAFLDAAGEAGDRCLALTETV